MKRIAVALLVVIMVISSHCFAEIDLSGMSFDELLELKEKINMALWECEEWQEVTVPVGVYEIGKDIPKGHWSIQSDGEYYTEVTWCYALDSTGKSSAKNAKIVHVNVFSTDYKRFDANKMTSEIDLNLNDGEYLIIENEKCVFKPYINERNLGFK